MKWVFLFTSVGLRSFQSMSHLPDFHERLYECQTIEGYHNRRNI